VANGICLKKPKFTQLLKISGFFGLFHIIMLCGGWFGGQNLKLILKNTDHWLAFGLLAFIGIKMIIQALKPEHKKEPVNLTDTKFLFLTSFATSLDALAVGITLSLVNVSIITAALIVGIITFVLSFIAALAGCRLSTAFGKKAEIFGGLILIFIAVKILVEHIK
jgi:putative Mn2+ efflux pump MntP